MNLLYDFNENQNRLDYLTDDHMMSQSVVWCDEFGVSPVDQLKDCMFDIDPLDPHAVY